MRLLAVLLALLALCGLARARAAAHLPACNLHTAIIAEQWKEVKRAYRDLLEEAASEANVSPEDVHLFITAAVIVALFAVAGLVCFIVSLALGHVQILYLVPAVVVAAFVIWIKTMGKSE